MGGARHRIAIATCARYEDLKADDRSEAVVARLY
jgi:hypothetical protein